MNSRKCGITGSVGLLVIVCWSILALVCGYIVWVWLYVVGVACTTMVTFFCFYFWFYHSLYQTCIQKDNQKRKHHEWEIKKYSTSFKRLIYTKPRVFGFGIREDVNSCLKILFELEHQVYIINKLFNISGNE